MRNTQGYTKRSLDLAIAGVLLILLAPLMLLTSLAILLWMGPPVLFVQRRPGLHGRPFHLIKFRTMQAAFDAQGRPLPDEIRLTPLGQFMRATSLDELPELWNVVRGEMSLVGPRPLLMQYLPLYTPEQSRRHEVLPGITGWAQVNGRNGLSWTERFALDVWYVDHVSLKIDLKILALTAVQVLQRKGISQPGHATMPDFEGSAPESD